MLDKLQKLRSDPVVFSEAVLGFRPFEYQKRILSDPSKRIVSCLGRQTGKTTTISAKAIFYATTHLNTTTLIVSPSLRQSMIMFDRILSFIYRSKILSRSIVRETRTIVQFTNGSQIVALPCSENLLRGYTANLAICDEAAFMPEDVIMNVIFPMLATTQGSLVLLSTPWGKDHLFYRAFVDPEWSVYKVKSSECPLISPEFLEEQKRLMTNEQFMREYEAEFSEAATTYFSQKLIRECVVKAQDMNIHSEEHPERFNFRDAYAGLDLGKIQDYSALSIIHKDGDMFKLIFHKQFPLNTPYPEIIGTVRRMHELAPFRKIAVDRTGVGVAVVDEMRRVDMSMLPVDGVMFTRQRKAEILGHLRILMEQGNLAIPYDRELCAQLNEQRYQYTPNGEIKFWHPEGAHDDRLWSLALAVYGSKKEKSGGEVIASW